VLSRHIVADGHDKNLNLIGEKKSGNPNKFLTQIGLKNKVSEIEKNYFRRYDDLLRSPDILLLTVACNGKSLALIEEKKIRINFSCKSG